MDNNSQETTYNKKIFSSVDFLKMFIPASSEFVELCQSQVSLLVAALRASWVVVYLTEELVEGREAKLIPVVAYPESAADLDYQDTLALNPTGTTLLQLPEDISVKTRPVELTDWEQTVETYANDGQAYEDKATNNRALRQIILPLLHEGVVMGLLVTSRQDRPWNKRERLQIEHIAHSLTLACLLDRRQANWGLNYRQQQLRQNQQNDLLDNLLHQVRSPLTALKTFGKLLLKRLKSTDKNRDLVGNLLRESERLQELLAQMDEVLAREEDVTASLPASEGLPLILPSPELEVCQVEDVLAPLLVSANAVAGERQQQVHSDIPAKLPAVAVNPQALREVLSNLIDNALKYTPSQGHIFVEVCEILTSGENEPVQKFIKVSVTDTGPGIPDQDIQHIFDRHYRGIQAETDIPGTGLGLAIARQLVEQMNGEIKVFSPALRELPLSSPGTTFEVWLPVAINFQQDNKL